MERFENAIFKQREEINNRMTEMFKLLKELIVRKTPKKVLIREEASHPVTRNVNSISLVRLEEEKSTKDEAMFDDISGKPKKSKSVVSPKEVDKEYEAENVTGDKLVKNTEEKLKKIDEDKLEDIGGNFEIPCNLGGLKHTNALVDQGSNVNIMPLSIYNKLTDERPTETDIRLSVASHLYIFPLGIAEDVLVDMLAMCTRGLHDLDKGGQKKPFILGTPFLTTAKAMIKFDKGTITLRSEKSKISFHRIPESNCKIQKGIKNDIWPIAPTMTVIFDEKSLEVLRKFHMMILGGRFNQLLHVSSPLLSKPMEY
nr:hypothetical protein [Tanacetum cinerariifolium]